MLQCITNSNGIEIVPNGSTSIKLTCCFCLGNCLNTSILKKKYSEKGDDDDNARMNKEDQMTEYRQCL